MNIINKLKHNKLMDFIFKKGIIEPLSLINPRLATKIIYCISQGYRLNLEKPQTLNEKLQYLKLNDYYKNELVTMCADKIRVRQYVKECGLEKILIKTVGKDVYSSVEEIDYENLPDKFVLKCNHDSGSVFVCKSKKEFDWENKRKEIRKALKSNYWKQNCELQYKYVKKAIMAESLLEDNDNKLTDIKIYCFNGKAKLLYLSTMYEHDEKMPCSFYDLDWKRLDFRRLGTVDIPFEIEKPENLTEMINDAEILAKPFPFVRVDLLLCNGSIYFTELTFIPTAGLGKYDKPDIDRKLGEMLTL